jgi:hypothetical protein
LPKRLADRVNVNTQRILLDKGAAPCVRHEIVLTDELARRFGKFLKDFEGA